MSAGHKKRTGIYFTVTFLEGANPGAYDAKKNFFCIVDVTATKKYPWVFTWRLLKMYYLLVDGSLRY